MKSFHLAFACGDSVCNSLHQLLWEILNLCAAVAAAAAESFLQTAYADKTEVQSPSIKKNLVYFWSTYNWCLSSVSLSI